MDRILDWLNFLKKRFYYGDGLCVLFFFLTVVYLFLTSQLRPGLNSIISACGWISLKPYFFLGGLLLCWLVGFVAWYWKRRLPRFRKHELGIIFAPNFPQDLEGEAQRLLAHLVQELKSKSLGNQFSIRTLPPNRNITSPDEATTIIRRCGGTVAVWGLIDRQSSDIGTRTAFSKISFTVVHPPIVADPKYHRRILTPLVGRRWHIDERNQILDRILLAQNIGIVVRNLLGMALLVSRHFDDAVKVFLPLCTDLHPLATPDSPVSVRQFYSDLKEDTAFCLRASTEVAYLDYLRTDRLFSIPSMMLNTWLNNVNEAIKLDRQNSYHYLIKAIYLFLLDRIPEATQAALTSQQLAPKAISAANFSLAFLYNFTGNFKKSSSQYKKALAKITSYDEELLRNILDFIRQAIIKFPEKPQLRFALGFLEINRGEQQRGRKEIETFLNKAANQPSLSEFTTEARRILGR